MVLREKLDVQLEALGAADEEINVLAEKNTSATAHIECVTRQFFPCFFRVALFFLGFLGCLGVFIGRRA